MSTETMDHGERRAAFPERDGAAQASLSQYFFDNSIDTRSTSSSDVSTSILPTLVIEDFNQDQLQSSENNNPVMAAEKTSHSESNQSDSTAQESPQGAEGGEDNEVLLASADRSQATGDVAETVHAGHEGTSDRLILEGPGGSRVEFDRETHLPLMTVDALGNEYEYRWDSGTEAPSYVSMRGPRTGYQLIEFRENTLADTVCNFAGDHHNLAARALGLSVPGFLDDLAIDYFFDSTVPATRYTVSVDGREQLATVSAGAGGGANVGPVSFNLGISQPIQNSVDLNVRRDGSLQIMQPAETWNGELQNRLLTLSNNLDGTTTQEVRTGFILHSTETVHRDQQGRPID